MFYIFYNKSCANARNPHKTLKSAKASVEVMMGQEITNGVPFDRRATIRIVTNGAVVATCTPSGPTCHEWC